MELAEGIEIRLRIAGPMLRAGAYVIDFVIRLIGLLVGVMLLSMAGWAIGGKVANGLILLVWFLLDWLYPVGLTADEARALAMFQERAGLWSENRRMEIADQVSVLSGAAGRAGVSRLLAMAQWVQQKRE